MSTTHAGRVVRDPNVTPLIDVMLVLLIIFMIVTPMIESGIAVELPTAEHLDPEQRELPLTISIEAGGEIHFR
ncbi:MAG: biopolymer transporter ExbD, partial [Gemmatimonadota bacterium]